MQRFAVLLSLMVAVIGFEASLFGAATVSAAITAPTLTSPINSDPIANFSPTLIWSNPMGVTQYQLQVVPFNNDGPGVDLHLGRNDAAYKIPAPPLWYGLLPDMTYTWRVRVSDARTFAT